jgi:hypothetical protein
LIPSVPMGSERPYAVRAVRAVRAIRARHDATRWAGQSPWGWRIAANGDLERDEEEERVVAVVRHMRANGHKIREIVSFLADLGVVGRRGKPIGTTRVFEMIHGGRTKVRGSITKKRSG